MTFETYVKNGVAFIKNAKPCPFCGSTEIAITMPKASIQRCGCNNVDCYTDGPECSTQEEAVEAWNKRIVEGESYE